MSIQEILAGGGGVLLVLMTLVEIAPVKISPWGAIAKVIGQAINREVMVKLDEMAAAQKDTRKRLDTHIKVDDERAADMHGPAFCSLIMSLSGTSHTPVRSLLRYWRK